MNKKTFFHKHETVEYYFYDIVKNSNNEKCLDLKSRIRKEFDRDEYIKFYCDYFDDNKIPFSELFKINHMANVYNYIRNHTIVTKYIPADVIHTVANNIVLGDGEGSCLYRLAKIRRDTPTGCYYG